VRTVALRDWIPAAGLREGWSWSPQHATSGTPAPIATGVILHVPPSESLALAKKPNYNLEKNRREQDRKKKKEEKRLRKLENRGEQAEPSDEDSDGGTVPPSEP
jgi:hypothetical protein